MILSLLLLLGGCTGHLVEPDGRSGPGSGGSAGNGGGCGDTLSNPSNCGACGRSCNADQICDQGVCRAATAGCSEGRLLCGASCVDGQANAAHCGACNNACAAGRTCSGGTCVCDGTLTDCGGACADLQTDAQHCGACNNACQSGWSCENGSCACPAGRTVCGDACVDTQTDLEHCGACNNTCIEGQVCMAGACACPAGQQLCSDTCIDTQANDEHCGACNQRCGLGESCAGGMCGGGGLGEDECSGLAQGLTIEQIAVYQSVKIQLMQANAAVDVASRNTDVVAGREAMFRVFVTVGQGFTARELSARIHVENGSTVDTYFAKQEISASSTDANTMSSFQIVVPKDKITTETRYVVEVVECGTGSGSVQSPRFPVTDGAELSARETGTLKVHILPVRANGSVPDTSTEALEPYREILLAMYPITDLEFTVGDTVETGYPIDWEGLVDSLRAKRERENPPSDVYYYGLLKPTSSIREFCSGSCTLGIGYVVPPDVWAAVARVAVGVGFADSFSVETMAHEIGHNHGRDHAPCGPVAGPDANFPYQGGRLGSWGYDARSQSFLDPNDNTDIMGYCDNFWISDYTYDAILNRVAAVNNAPEFAVLPQTLRHFRVLLVSERGPRWGHATIRPSLPTGTPELADVLDATGNVLEAVEVYRTALSIPGSFSIQVPVPKPGWHSIRVGGMSPLPF